ncbi:hypothetical protein NOLU111490_15215 [Novosphingobium lubricantis]
MVSIIRALAGEPGIPAGFPILFDADMAIIEPAFLWRNRCSQATAIQGMSSPTLLAG